MIIDCHAHIRSADETELAGILELADRAGVDKLCISSLGRQWTYFPTAEVLEEANSDVIEACRRYPGRFIGAVYLSADHVEKSLEELDRCVVHGTSRMVKLWVSQFVDDPRLNPLIERCIELDIPILQHTWTKATGNLPKESTCFHVAAMAQRYPAMKIWMAHCGGLWEESARVVCGNPNVSMDVSGGEPEDGIVDCLLKHLGRARIFYGSDIPGRSFVVQMTKVLSASIDEATQAMILGENVRKWLHV
ncbi:MAG TPA: amidohydrolase family protein [Candidatus Hydrogenedentes bacterium]|nr:amidohydrolase family protein [Candidatus Hydrogenedentota bacterium]HPG65832.1 amidohydrolase family protein [Candidatus Hydrogenedentota bacterium]